MPLGKYAGYKMSDIKDVSYMNWFVDKMKNKHKYLRLIRTYFVDRIKQLESQKEN